MVVAEFRLVEPVAALSVATDHVRGQPPGQALLKTVIATALAERLGLTSLERHVVYYATLLRAAGCTATSHEFALHLGGDDVAVRFGGDAVDTDDLAQLTRLLARLGKAGMHPDAAMGVVAAGSVADREVAGRVVTRLGLGAGVVASVRRIFERWDGRGVPDGIAGEDIPVSARVSHVASVAVMFAQAQGRDEALTVLARWAGRTLDPAIVGVFIAHADELLHHLEAQDAWAAVLAAEPRPWRMASGEHLDEVCRVFGAFADLKTPYLLGHSAHVARLAEDAARALKLPEADCLALRRAGLVHDLGRVGIATGIWEKAAPLGALEMEHVRLHPYHTERILERSSLLQPLAHLAGRHHERMDGSGYFRGVTASSLDMPARILAAADACAELLEERPGRTPLTPDIAGIQLWKEALDPDALRAVLQVAGATGADVAGQRPASLRPGGLTAREVDVLRLLARGQTLKQIAEQLVISPSTAHTHAAHIYEKAGISTRAGAALFAMEHGLID